MALRIERGEGVECRFFHQKRRYLFLDDYKYWIMVECSEVDLDAEDHVLNRARFYRDRRDFVIQGGDTGKWGAYPANAAQAEPRGSASDSAPISDYDTGGQPFDATLDVFLTLPEVAADIENESDLTFWYFSNGLQSDMVLLSVNSDAALETALDAKRTEGLHYRTWWDGHSQPGAVLAATDGPIATAWGVRGWPMSYVLDEQGVIRYVNKFGGDLIAVVDKLVKEKRRNAS